jgi:hypothetical protein
MKEDESKRHHLVMVDVISSWQETYKKQETIVESKFLNFYEYQKNKDESIKELIEQREKIKQKYVKLD